VPSGHLGDASSECRGRPSNSELRTRLVLWQRSLRRSFEPSTPRRLDDAGVAQGDRDRQADGSSRCEGPGPLPSRSEALLHSIRLCETSQPGSPAPGVRTMYESVEDLVGPDIQTNRSICLGVFMRLHERPCLRMRCSSLAVHPYALAKSDTFSSGLRVLLRQGRCRMKLFGADEPSSTNLRMQFRRGIRWMYWSPIGKPDPHLC